MCHDHSILIIIDLYTHLTIRLLTVIGKFLHLRYERVSRVNTILSSMLVLLLSDKIVIAPLRGV